MFNKKIYLVLFIVVSLILSSFPVSSSSFDINKDGNFDVLDVTAFQKYLVRYVVDIDVIDVNEDGRININDATYVQRTLVGLDNEIVGYEGALIVNGTDVAVGEYIKFEEFEVDLPLLLISESLGCEIEWVDEKNVIIMHNEKKYILNTSDFTIVEEGDSQNLLLTAPGGERRCKVLGKEVIISEETIHTFLYELGASMRIDYEQRLIYINSNANYIT